MFMYEIDENGIIKGYSKKVVRKYSDMKEFFQWKREDNPTIYEVYECETKGLNFATTIIFPGRVGKEYFMTKGHVHKKKADEIYIGVKGKGLILLQSKDDFLSFEIKKDMIIHVPENYAHRTVNIGDENLVFLAVYASDAGHDYDFIKRKGFRKIVIEKNGKHALAENPKW
ncbi:MAG: cupin domain-containing protein [Methanomicrobia archaeon]|nr:cupin domain-containing protein [Methanomicrobia archaeon]